MSALYSVLLVVHSILRWLVLIFGVLAMIQAYRGWLAVKSYSNLDRRLGTLFSMSLDIQVLIGIILYFFVSPTTTGALRNFGGAMSDPTARYFLVEHSVVMLIAVVLVHVGRAMARRVSDRPALSHQRLAIFYTLAFAAIIFAIPWPFMPTARPWIRFG